MVMKNKKAQVWVETVIYTLIAFVILGAVLAFARPKIQELQDKAIIERSIEMLQDIDSIVREIEVAQGNIREIELGIKKGELIIDLDNDEIRFELETNNLYSEPGETIQEGIINIKTEEHADLYKVMLNMSYNHEEDISGTLTNIVDYDLLWDDANSGTEVLQSSGTPYRVFISNDGPSQTHTSQTPVPTEINFRFVN